MSDLAGTILGWIGTVGTLSAYLLIARGVVQSTGKRYAALNAFGGTFASFGALAFGAWPAFVSNLIWALIGFHALSCAIRRDRSERKLARNSQVLPAPAPTELEGTLLATQPIPLVHPQAIRLPSQAELQHYLHGSDYQAA